MNRTIVIAFLLRGSKKMVDRYIGPAESLSLSLRMVERPILVPGFAKRLHSRAQFKLLVTFYSMLHQHTTRETCQQGLLFLPTLQNVGLIKWPLVTLAITRKILAIIFTTAYHVRPWCLQVAFSSPDFVQNGPQLVDNGILRSCLINHRIKCLSFDICVYTRAVQFVYHYFSLIFFQLSFPRLLFL